jgi:uncharacterized protein YjiS (DUF1127 family)
VRSFANELRDRIRSFTETSRTASRENGMQSGIGVGNECLIHPATEGSRVRARLGRVARVLAARIEAAARRRAAKALRRETTRGLRMLDDRLLADIGLKRSEIEFALGERPVTHISV